MSGQFGSGAEESYAHFGTWVRSVSGRKCLDTNASLCAFQYSKCFIRKYMTQQTDCEVN